MELTTASDDSVWVVIWEHKYGTDTLVADGPDSALAVAWDLVNQGKEGLEDEEWVRIQGLWEADDGLTAIEVYEKATNESINIQERHIHRRVTNTDVMAEAVAENGGDQCTESESV